MTGQSASPQPSIDALDRLWAEYRASRDHDLFAHVVDACQPLVVAVARRYLRRSIDVEDAAQEVFIRLLRYTDQVNSPRAWLYTCTRSVAVDLARRAQRQSLGEVNDLVVADAHENTVGKSEDLRVLDACLHCLSDSDREVIVGIYIDGCSQQQLATRMGMSQAAVSLRLAGAMQRLKALCRKRGIALAGLLLLCESETLWAAEPIPDLAQRLSQASGSSVRRTTLGIGLGCLILALALTGSAVFVQAAQTSQSNAGQAELLIPAPAQALAPNPRIAVHTVPAEDTTDGRRPRFLAWEPWHSNEGLVLMGNKEGIDGNWLSRATGTAVRLRNRRSCEFGWTTIPLGTLAAHGAIRLDLETLPATCSSTGIAACVPTASLTIQDRLILQDEKEMNRLLLSGKYHTLSAHWEVRGGAVRVTSRIDDHDVAIYECNGWPTFLVINMINADVEIRNVRADPWPDDHAGHLP